ncbi:site-specific integrase [Kordiimonas sp. SCSIO 12603]|uniref:tyrosine-type recombinase/integrase n=1 Tax=Kordiimonas sp. SCSIO 12603 TaxID=2829596 RepID=UPI002102AD27|nr:site-specific integrase [Kordiimonas sp. SCSIO 12603]UTW59526.1 site-specific integrase [Kordiimonas sp. SCSIO 12603]
MAHYRKYYTSRGDLRYRAEVRVKGAKPISKAFRRLSDAKEWAKEQEDASKRLSAGLHDNKHYTLAEAIDRYCVERLPLLRNKTTNPALNWWRKELGSRYIHTIRRSEVIDKRSKLQLQPIYRVCRKTGAHITLYKPDGSIRLRLPKTVQAYVDELNTLFNIAMDEWEWIENNPLRRIKKLKANNERVRFLSDHYHMWPGHSESIHWDELTDLEKQDAKIKFPRAYELPRLLDAAKSQKDRKLIRRYHPEWTYQLLTIQLGTGLRLGEATHLVWEENDLIEHPIVVVDMKEQRLILKSTKSDTSPRVKPLAGKALEELIDLYENRRFDTPLVFPNSSGKKPLRFDSRIRIAIDEAGLEDFRWHDLRHTTASYLGLLGANQREIQEALHHRSIKSSERYQHVSNDHLRGLFDKFSRIVQEEKRAVSRFS